jgi:hypothetical protein
MRASLTFAVFLLLTSTGNAAHARANASQLSVRQAHPWGFGASFSWLPTGVPSFASIGAAAERAFGRWFAVEAGAETGLQASTPSASGARLEPHLVARLSARPMLPLDRQERNSLFLSVGPQLLIGGAYDGVVMAHTEAGYHLRTWSGVSLLLAAVANFAVSERPVAAPADCPAGCAGGDITYGTRSVGFRVALGTDF